MKRTVRYSICVFMVFVLAISMVGCADSTERNDNNNLSEAQQSLSSEEAIELLREQLIVAYEETYGEFIPSDAEPSALTGDKERLSYVIPRLTVKEETEQYFIIPVIWDFYVDKETHKIYKFYNGIDELFILFDPHDRAALAFAG